MKEKHRYSSLVIRSLDILLLTYMDSPLYRELNGYDKYRQDKPEILEQREKLKRSSHFLKVLTLKLGLMKASNQLKKSNSESNSCF